eukprot:SAG31_NODE_109_length_24587_cov_111.480848_6_plen_453_part_00
MIGDDRFHRSRRHGLVVDSAADVLEFVEMPRRVDDKEEIEAAIDVIEEVHEEDDAEDKDEEKPQQPVLTGWEDKDTPLFEVELYDDDDGFLRFDPTREDVSYEMQKMMESFVITVGALPSLSSDRSLRTFTSLVDQEEANEDALQMIVEDDLRFRNLELSVQEALAGAFSLADQCKMIFEPYLTMVLENHQIDISEVKERAQSGHISLQDFQQDMGEYASQQRRINNLPQEAYLGLVHLNSGALREKFLPSPAKCLGDIQLLLPELGQEKVTTLMKEISDANSVLHSKVSNPEEFCKFLEFVEDLQSRQDDLQDTFFHISDHYELMEEQEVFVPPTQLAMYQSLEIEYTNMKSSLDIVESRKQEDIQQFNIMLEANIKMLQEDRKEARNAALDELFLDYNPTGMEEGSEVMVKLGELEATAASLKEQAEKIQKQQKLFNKVSLCTEPPLVII